MMLLTFIIEAFVNWFASLWSVLRIEFFEMIHIPEGLISSGMSLLQVGFYFIPASTVPIFVLVPSIWAFKILVAVVEGFFTTLSRIPILAKFIY